MIKAADLELLERMRELHRLNQSGQLDLNTGEVLFATNMQIAFHTKLFADVGQIAIVRAERVIGSFAMNSLRTIASLAAGPYFSVIVLGMPTVGRDEPRRSPVRPVRPTIIRLDRNEVWMRALAVPRQPTLIDRPPTREELWRRALAAPGSSVR